MGSDPGPVRHSPLPNRHHEEQLIEAIKDPQVKTRLRRLFDKLAEESTVRLTLQRLSSVRFFDLTKDGDFEADHWHERTRLQRLLDDAERMIRR